MAQSDPKKVLLMIEDVQNFGVEASKFLSLGKNGAPKSVGQV